MRWGIMGPIPVGPIPPPVRRSRQTYNKIAKFPVVVSDPIMEGYAGPSRSAPRAHDLYAEVKTQAGCWIVFGLELFATG